MQWWGDTLEQFELVSGDLEVEAMEQFIVAINDRPFGYLQCYDPDVWPENGLGAHPRGTRGIDQFIGEQDMVDRGHGSAFIRDLHRPAAGRRCATRHHRSRSGQRPRDTRL